ncbi:MAG: hypothetical protein JO227_07245 [Acetobacteraceae bacterium]|nr:hypothetical protein [Acetobacteraceae bacterium]
MAAGVAFSRGACRALGLAAGACMTMPVETIAFPVTDQTNPSVLQTPAELAAPDVQELRHHMGLLSGLGAAGGGWNIYPRLTVEEIFNDNVLQVPSPRRWDLGTVIAPGIAVVGDTPRVQLKLDYTPAFEFYARNGDQNGLSQQLNAVANVTVVPDLFYVDLRALAGVQPAQGAFGGTGGLGTTGYGPITPTTIGGQTGNTQGLSKSNRVQTMSFSVAPYVLHRFGDWGTGKAGVSFSHTSSAAVSNNSFLPFAGGSDVTTQTTTEEIAQFETGDYFNPFRDLIIADAIQSNQTGTSAIDLSQQIISNRLGYLVSHTVTVFGDLGYENIRYSGAASLNISDVTWGVGTTVTPNPDSTFTVEYGHREGTNSVNAYGHYALTARTSVGVRYSTGLATELDQVRTQLNLADLDNNGTLVDAQTGGPLFGGSNTIGRTPGLFRYRTLSGDITTVRDRDTYSLAAYLTEQTAAGTTTPSGPVTLGSLTTPGSSNKATSVTLSYTRELTPDLGFNAAITGSWLDLKGQLSTKTWSVNATAGLQYAFSETLAGILRYSFFESGSSLAGQSIYQNLVIVGLTKQF